jgi:major membrane immunogen (membrane-anchored lipoprotein)
MRVTLIKLAIAVSVLLTACAAKDNPANSANRNAPVSLSQSDKPKNGFVPNEKTAISIAVAVWIPLYGAQEIENEKPYKATLKDGVWNVTSTLPQGKYAAMSEADIDQEDGCILRVAHPAFTF